MGSAMCCLKSTGQTGPGQVGCLVFVQDLFSFQPPSVILHLPVLLLLSVTIQPPSIILRLPGSVPGCSFRGGGACRLYLKRAQSILRAPAVLTMACSLSCTGNPSKKKKARSSAALLSCPCCFTTVCVDCVKADEVSNQWCAIDAQNCVINQVHVHSCHTNVPRKTGAARP